MKQIEVTIDALGAQGDGIARTPDKTIFISGALPGERVRIDLAPSADRIQRAELVDILFPSPERTKPPCPHFKICGGCQLQHLAPPLYRAHQSENLDLLFRKEGLFPSHLLPLITTPPHSRRRARFIAKQTEQGTLIGFNGARSHRIVDVHTCPILAPPLVTTLELLRKNLSLWLPPRQSCDIQATLLNTGLDVVLIGGRKLDLESREKMATLASALNTAQLSWRKDDRSPIEPIAHNARLSVSFEETSVPFPPGSFLQASPTGEEALLRFAQKHIPQQTTTVDLFCGLGGFGLSLKNPKAVTMVDIDGPAIDALTQTIKNKTAYKAQKRNLMKDPLSGQELSAFDAILFDPPRSGAETQVRQIAQSAVPCVVAISCNPASFVRDAKILIEGGYHLGEVQPVDQFLWSTHMELAAHFYR